MTINKPVIPKLAKDLDMNEAELYGLVIADGYSLESINTASNELDRFLAKLHASDINQTEESLMQQPA